MGQYYGYNRVNEKERYLDRGQEAIMGFCKNNGYPLVRIYEDKITDKGYDRPRFIVLTEDILNPGDTLIIPEFDKLGSAEETRDILKGFKQSGIRVIFLDIPTTMIDLSSFTAETAKVVAGCIIDMLISSFDLQAKVEFRVRGERSKKKIRIMSKEDFAAAYQRVIDGEIGSLDLMRELGLNRDTYFRYVREYKANDAE